MMLRNRRTVLLRMLLCVLFLIPVFINVSSHASEAKADVMEAKRSSYALTETNPTVFDFPGGRGTNEMILYTPEFGKNTGTNQYGSEAVVVEGVIQTVGGNSSDIPENGFVLSGHGEAGSWLIENAMYGAKVEVGGGTVAIIVDAETYIINAEWTIDDAMKALKTASADYVDINYGIAHRELMKAQKMIKQAKSELDEKNPALLKTAESALTSARNAIMACQASEPVEYRGAWYRLVETSEDELIKTLDRYAAAGMNVLLPETHYNGYMIYPGKIYPQHPQFIGWDPLKVMVEEGHKRGIEIHIWVENFFIGNVESPLMTEHPDWMALNRKVEMHSTLERWQDTPGYLYFEPAHPGPRQLVYDVYKEVLENYDIDGIQLDYIRYPSTEPWEEGYSYNKYARDKFKEFAGVDPMDITPDSDPENWKKWDLWREDVITLHVDRLVKMFREVRPDVSISAAVFPDPEHAISNKKQNWPMWYENGRLDYVASMAYTTDSKMVTSQVQDNLTVIDKKDYLPGLGEYLGLTPQQMVDQIQTTRENGTIGNIIFQLSTMEEDTLHGLELGVYRTRAISPFSNVSEKYVVYLADLRRKIKKVYARSDGIKPEAREDVLARLDKLPEDLNVDAKKLKKMKPERELDRLIKAVKKFEKKNQIKEPVARQLMKDIFRLKNLVR
jgi:uncharacterized lipoprotein YddW (UPF0748 family)